MCDGAYTESGLERHTRVVVSCHRCRDVTSVNQTVIREGCAVITRASTTNTRKEKLIMENPVEKIKSDTNKYSINPKGGGKTQNIRDKRKAVKWKVEPEHVKEGIKVNRPTLRYKAEVTPVDAKSKTHLEAVFKRDAPNTET